MMIISRRNLLIEMGCLSSLLAFRSSISAQTRKTIPGAIRWDAWYTQSAINSAASAALSPPEWHFRAPWFARIRSDDSLDIEASNQEIIDTEIRYAISAGLKYWAYVWYGEESPMQTAWKLHQNSNIKDKMHWCLILAITNQGGPVGFRLKAIEYVNYMSKSNYQRVLDSRPLVFLFINGTSSIDHWGGIEALSDSIKDLRSIAKAYSVSNPYVVMLYGPAAVAAQTARLANCDAISTYVPNVVTGSPVLWNDQEKAVEKSWTLYAETGVPIIVNCLTGWDQRPRLKRSNANAKEVQQYSYTVPPSLQQLSQHLQAGVNFVNAHPSECPSRAILIYSWDECDEGGNALIPSFTPKGPDTTELAAAHKVRW